MARKIVKTVEIGISGKYQTQRFVTSVEETIGDELPTNGGDVEAVADQLHRTAFELTVRDIHTRLVAAHPDLSEEALQAQLDADFVTIFAARKEELDKFRLYQKNQASLAVKRPQS